MRKIKVGMLRQWLNEDRGCSPLVTNEDLIYWLEADNKDSECESVTRLRTNLLADPRAEVEGNQVWNAVVNQVLKLTEPKKDYGA